MAKTDNLNDFLKDIADAIREKTEDSGLINAQNFADKIRNLSTGSTGRPEVTRPTWTGHADADGLRAIGWTDEDIAYYQEHGVNWNEEDDHLHLVSDDNKALYGVLTANNISTYKERIVYLPKIDFSTKGYNWHELFNGCYAMVAIPSLVTTATVTTMKRMFLSCNSLVSVPLLDTAKVTDMSSMFSGCNSLVSIPQLDTTNVTDMSSMFSDCKSLVSIPQLNTINVTSMSYMFSGCNSLVNIPQLDTAKVTNMGSMFNGCYSLVSIPQLDTQNVTNMSNMFYNCNSLVSVPLLDTAKVTNMSAMFYNCNSLVSIPQLNTQNVTNMSSMFMNCSSLIDIPQLDTANVTSMSSMFYNCYSLTNVNLKNAKLAYQLNNSALLSKESLLYIINNESATSAVTIKIKAYAYTRLANDPDIVAALANHPNISIAQ